MTTTTRNGTIRKSLAEQIDRLDRTLDGLSDNLNQAVADAVKAAVQTVLLEVLTSPDLASVIRNAASPTQNGTSPPSTPIQETTPPRRPGFFARVWTKTRRAVQVACVCVGLGVDRVAQSCCHLVKKAWAGCRYLGGLVFSGLNWTWAKVNALGTAVVTFVRRPALAVWTKLRSAFACVFGLATGVA